MSKLRIDSFAKKCAEMESEMELFYRDVAPSFVFSNSGRRGGKKYFAISLLELQQTLKDIYNHLDQYSTMVSYDEQAMRDLFHATVSTETVNALSTVQTLPLYNLVNKVICASNDLTYRDKELLISEENIKNAIDYIDSQLPDNEDYLNQLSIKISDSNSVTNEIKKIKAPSGENVIFYGAPGVGKSHKIEEKCDPSTTIRTVLHPDSQYSDFAGCLKPRMDGGKVIYDFRTGPFCKAIVNAYQTPEKHHYLIIEEIKRAPAAAVFGEIFQLLDRADDGASRFPVTLSDPDMIETLRAQAPSSLVGDQIRIPGNLSLMATMNSSDQAVMPLDTAFKRRWKFEYIPIDFSNCPNGKLIVPFSDGDKEVEWKHFAETINHQLESDGIPEDRLLGPWFLSPAELSSTEDAKQSLKGKLLMYLWDDVLRHREKTILFDDVIQNFGQLISTLEKGQQIFNDIVETKLINNSSDSSFETSPKLMKVAESDTPTEYS